MDSGPPVDSIAPLGVIFEHAYRNQRIYRATGTGHLHRLIGDALRDHLTRHDLRMPVEMVVEYHVSALVGVLAWWVRAGFPNGPAETARMCRTMTQAGVMAALTEEHLAEVPR